MDSDELHAGARIAEAHLTRRRRPAVMVAALLALVIVGAGIVVGVRELRAQLREQVETAETVAARDERRADRLQEDLDAARFAHAADRVAAAFDRARLEEEVRVLNALLEREGVASPIPSPPVDDDAPDPPPAAEPTPPPTARPAPDEKRSPPPPENECDIVEVFGRCLI